MEHAREIELIELAAGRLDADREKAVLAHVETCAVCQAKLAEMRTTWDLLGAWEVSPPGGLDVGRVQAAERPSQPRTIRLVPTGLLLRVAASIGVATLLGYTAGRWSIGPDQTAASVEPPSYLSVLGLQAGESLSPLILDDESSVVEGG